MDISTTPEPQESTSNVTVGCKRSSFCSTPAKKWQDLGPAASKALFVWMKYHQDQKCNQSKNALENR